MPSTLSFLAVENPTEYDIMHDTLNTLDKSAWQILESSLIAFDVMAAIQVSMSPIILARQ